MKMPTVRFLVLAALVGLAPPRSPAADPPPWKELATFRVPTAPTKVFLSDDHRWVLAQHEQKSQPFAKGGTAPAVATFRILRCYAADSGKEFLVVNKDKNVDRLRELLAVKADALALADDADKVHVYDLHSSQESGLLDTTAPTDFAPGVVRKISGDVRLGDLEFTADGKTLVTVREEGEWIKDNKAVGGFIGKSFQRLTFWDVDKKAKVDSLDCEDREARNGRLRLLPRSNGMLVRFDNGARILDLATRRWGTIFGVKDVATASPSGKEQTVAITDHAQNVHVFDVATGKEIISFKVAAVSKRLRLDKKDRPIPGVYEAGPVAVFVEQDEVLRVTLNDGKTVVYRDAATGMEVKKPAAEALTFPGNPRVLALARDRDYAVTASPQSLTTCTIWRRGEVDKGTAKGKEER
jgi:hypothetical protein